jgi:hypothetical protein
LPESINQQPSLFSMWLEKCERNWTLPDYLRGAGIALRRPGGWGRHSPPKAAIDPITDSEGVDSKAAIEVITGFLARKPGCGRNGLRSYL